MFKAQRSTSNVERRIGQRKPAAQRRGYRFPEFLLSLFFILGGAAVVSYEQLQLMLRVFLIRRRGCLLVTENLTL
jgi:hypothetical protein